MATPQERISAAIKFFFEQALPQASGKKFSDLPDPLVHVGAYTAYTGQPVATSVGQSLTPKFVLRVMPALAASGGLPQAPGEIPTTGGAERPLVWLRQAADVKVDTEEEIRRVMADVESFAPILQADLADEPADAGAPAAPPVTAAPPTTPAPGGPAPTPAPGGPATPGTPAAGAASGASLRAADWARGLVAARASMPDDLNTLTTVPEPLTAVAADAEALRTVLRHFFTYDANGKYYPRWAGAGRDGSNPAHLRPEYKTDNVREVQLERECLYLYAVVPESLLSPGGGLDQTAFREIVIRFNETGVESPPFALATVHTARWRRTTAPHCDFVFVYTQEGLGIPQTRGARQKMSSALQALLGLIEEAGAQREGVLAAMPNTYKANDIWYVSMNVRLDGAATLPAGVLADGEVREWNAMQVPLDRIAELAALPTVTFLGITAPPRKSLDLARAEVKFPGFEAKIAAAKRGGKGVLVGIIDTGIDGSHPAFGSRIHAVWDQDPPATITGKSPKDNNAANDKYKLLNFGVELTKTTAPSNVTHSADPEGHGTHVAGIAAGAEVKDAAGKVLVPAGAAPEATIVAVRAIGDTITNSDWVRGVAYILLKAKELGLPCVINMSFGSHEHGHDGSDADGLTVFNQLTDGTKTYQPGRIVIAAAGNERSDPIHTRRSMPKAGPGSYKRLSTMSLGSLIPASDPVRFERIEIWIRNPTNTCPKSFPVGLVVYRQKTATTFDVTTKVMLGEPHTGALFPALNTKIQISSQAAEHINGDYLFQVSFSRIDLTKSMTRADWSVAMDNQVAHPLDVHLWITRGGSIFKDVTAADRSFLVGSPADGAAAVSIAASVTKVNWTDSAGTAQPAGGTTGQTLHDIANFSSPGPLRAASIPIKNVHGVAHEVNAVDVTAPGCLTLAALSSQWVVPANEKFLQANARGIHLQGTSMASPLVTGLVANLLAEEPALTMPDVLARLKKSAAIPAASKFKAPPATAGAQPYSNDWGYGLIDASKLKP